MASVNYEGMPLVEPMRKKGPSFFLTWQKASAALVLLFGLAVSVISLYTLINGAINDSRSSSTSATPAVNPMLDWSCPVDLNPSAPPTAPQTLVPTDSPSIAPASTQPTSEVPTAASSTII